ncbi:MAG: hypothetical protein QNJ75_05255 [Acidimicrobiia bacterium]|nr:hypothetical protein [Acidimicrobiia bacterium]
MKDTEFIYSLYVQANPVPDPDLLPATRDEAALLTFERSPDMITEERVSKGQPATRPRRKRLVTAVATAAVVMVAVVAAAIVMSGDSAPVAAEDAILAVVCDGTTCTYEGPTLIEVGKVEVSMTNSSTEILALHGWLMEGEALDFELEQLPIGTDRDVTGEPMPDGIQWFSMMVDPGQSWTRPLTLGPGTHLLDCKEEGLTEYVWRVAKLEVVEP